MELGHLLECSSSVRILLYYDSVEVYAAVVEEVGVDTCIYLVGVGRNTDFAQEVVVAYFFSPEVVLCVHPWLPVEPEAVVNAHFFCLSWFFDFFFFCFQGKFSKCAHQLHLLDPDVLAVSEVSPFVVEVALGINA